MLSSGTSPPIGVKESCIEFTAPQEASVVIVGKSVELKTPKRTSLPCMLPGFELLVLTIPSAVRLGLPRDSAHQQVRVPIRKTIAIAAHTAQPCFWFLTTRPR